MGAPKSWLDDLQTKAIQPAKGILIGHVDRSEQCLHLVNRDAHTLIRRHLDEGVGQHDRGRRRSAGY